jgi:hypothetical protein
MLKGALEVSLSARWKRDCVSDYMANAFSNTLYRRYGECVLKYTVP